MNRDYLPNLAALTCAAACLAPMATVLGFLSISVVQAKHGWLVPTLVMLFTAGALIVQHAARAAALVLHVIGALCTGALGIYLFTRVTHAGQYVSVGWGLMLLIAAAAAWLVSAIIVYARPA